jgi:hypothetical protein
MNDERFNDVGIFQISTIGMPTTANGVQIGELWATYDITFLKPALPDLHSGTSALFSASGLASGSFLMGGVQLWDQASSYPVKVINNNQLQLPVGYAGTYNVTINVTGALTDSPGLIIPSSWGSDITPVKILPGYTAPSGATVEAIPFTSAENYAGGLTAGNYNDATNSVSGKGWTSVFTFSTIAESLANNVLTFAINSSTTTLGTTVSMLINAVDSDLPSGKYGVLPPTNVPVFAVRKMFEQRLLKSAEDANRLMFDLQTERTLRESLEQRLLRLELISSAKIEPLLPAAGSLGERVDTNSSEEEEYGIASRPSSASAVVEGDSRTSVYLSRSLMTDLLRRKA